MARETMVRGAVAVLAIGALLGSGRPAVAEDAAGAGDRIVPPSEYVDDIETPGKTGGVEDEVDAADAQAEETDADTEKAAPPADPADRAAAITTDLLIGRPTALMATVAGSALYALSFPITFASGTGDEALERFVEEPGNRLIGPLGE